MTTIPEPFNQDEIYDMRHGSIWQNCEELALKVNELIDTVRVLNDEAMANRERIRLLEKHEKEG